MALKDNASLALIPAAYKTSKIYSAIPTDGDGDFTFTRSGNATRVNKAGLVETIGTNIGRLNYDLTNGTPASCPSLLLETSRTNLLQRSAEFDNTYYTKFDTSITPNVITSPDGSLNADEITKESDYGSISKTAITISSGSNYTLSIFVKKGTTNFFSLRQASGSYDVRKQFNLITKEVTDAPFANQNGFISSEIEDYPDNWYRLSIICTSNSTSLDVSFYSGKVAESTFNGDSYIWGAQLEAGSYATSYIPTTTGVVTRTADFVSGGGDANLFNDSEGTLFVEAKVPDNNTSVINVINISDGTLANRVLFQWGGALNRLRTYVVVAYSTQTLIETNSYNTEGYLKIAVRYKTNDVAFYVNGTKINFDNNANTFPEGTLNTIDFTNGNLGSDYYFNGNIKQLMYFDTALSDSELQTLTS